MQEANEHGSRISLLVGEHSRMGCQLMETALRGCHHISVVGSVVESSELIEAYENVRPDVCVISSALRDGQNSGFRVARELHSNFRNAAIILLLEFSERNLVVEAFRSGARGVFSRDDSFELLARCVQRVHEGQVWANSQQLQFAIEALTESPPSAIVDAKGAHILTKRELSAVELVAAAFSNRHISPDLRLPEHPGTTHPFPLFTHSAL